MAANSGMDSAALNVYSGLAFVPLAATPTCNAIKATPHSWSQSRHYQLRTTSVVVIEVAPPAVATDLMPQSRGNPIAMQLDAYIAETMGFLASDASEIRVESVKRLRGAEAPGNHAAVFGMLNAAWC